MAVKSWMVAPRPDRDASSRLRRRNKPTDKDRSGGMYADCLDQLLAFDLLDYITPWEVDQLVSMSRKGKHQQRELALSIVDYGLRERLILIGDLKGGFVPWKVPTRRDAIRRLEAIWKEPQDSKGFRLGFWLDRTERGWIRSFALVAKEDVTTRLEVEAMERLLVLGLTGIVTGEAVAREALRAESEFALANAPKLRSGPTFGGILAAGLHQGFFVIGKTPDSKATFRALPSDRSYADEYPKRLFKGELCLQITESGARRANKAAL